MCSNIEVSHFIRNREPGPEIHPSEAPGTTSPTVTGPEKTSQEDLLLSQKNASEKLNVADFY